MFDLVVGLVASLHLIQRCLAPCYPAAYRADGRTLSDYVELDRRLVCDDDFRLLQVIAPMETTGIGLLEKALYE
jgi:hypothetical protein